MSDRRATYDNDTNVLAGVLGAIAMFVWSAIAHMALPLGHAGIKELPNESAVLDAMKTAVGDKTGLYLFPGIGADGNPTKQQEEEAKKNYGEKLAKNPSGLLMYHPAGAPTDVPEGRTCLPSSCATVLFGSCANILMMRNAKSFVRPPRWASSFILHPSAF